MWWGQASQSQLNGVQFSVGGGYSYYQWYYNDTAINGANISSYTPQPNKFGSYKVEVGNDFNCRIFSDPRFMLLPQP
jgi:hypothetical protein